MALAFKLDKGILFGAMLVGHPSARSLETYLLWPLVAATVMLIACGYFALLSTRLPARTPAVVGSADLVALVGFPFFGYCCGESAAQRRAAGGPQASERAIVIEKAAPSLPPRAAIRSRAIR